MVWPGNIPFVLIVYLFFTNLFVFLGAPERQTAACIGLNEQVLSYLCSIEGRHLSMEDLKMCSAAQKMP